MQNMNESMAMSQNMTNYRDPIVKPKIHMDSATIIRIHMAMSQNMSEP